MTSGVNFWKPLPQGRLTESPTPGIIKRPRFDEAGAFDYARVGGDRPGP